MIHDSLILQLEQQILDAETANRSHREYITRAFAAQEVLKIGSDQYNKISQKVHSVFREIEDNHLIIARLYRKLEKLESKNANN